MKIKTDSLIHKSVIQFPTASHLQKSFCEKKECEFDIFKTRDFLSNRLIIQEKIEGYGLSCYFMNGKAVIRHKGKQVTYPVYRDGFKSWIKERESVIADVIRDRLVIFGVWPKKGHYINLPDLFLIHDVYDNKEKRFWCNKRIEMFCKILTMSPVPKISEGVFHVNDLIKYSNQKAKFGKNKISSVYLRYEDDFRVMDRAQFCNLSA